MASSDRRVAAPGWVRASTRLESPGGSAILSDRWRSLLDACPSPALLRDARGGLSANRAWREVFGAPGDSSAALGLVRGYDGSRAGGVDAPVAATLALQQVDGRPLRCAVSTLTFDHQPGVAGTVLWICAPIEEELAAREELVSVVCHDLRTPINAMVGWLHVLSSPDTAQPVRERALDGIDRAVRQQKALVETMQDAARGLRGDLPLTIVEADLAGLVDAAVRRLVDASAARRVQWSCALPGESQPVRCDLPSTERALNLLLEGALRQAPPGATLTATVARDSRWVLLTVTQRVDDPAGPSSGPLAALRTLDGRLATSLLAANGAHVDPGEPRSSASPATAGAAGRPVVVRWLVADADAGSRSAAAQRASSGPLAE